MIELDLDDIQRMIVLPRKTDALTIWFLRARSARDMRALLSAAAPAVTTAGDHLLPRHGTTSVAVTADGLRLAGVDSADLPTGPFARGMRQSVARLGDVGASAPTTWDAPFRIKDDPVHAAVLRHHGGLESHDARHPALGWLHPYLQTMNVGDPWRGARRANDEEPFGFVDGISTPIIEGAGELTSGNGVWDDTLEPPRWRAVRPGELVLGYPNERGSVSGTAAASAFERNGSYLVLRKLEQDVRGFEHECAARAHEVGTEPWVIAAGIVGRGYNGTVLGDTSGCVVNGFRYGDGGRIADAVKPSAHIRRANPRDGIDLATHVVPRHIMFRRGVPYDDGAAVGILFMACCADLDAQFEFVQSQWIQDGETFGLGTERDGLVGRADRRTDDDHAAHERVPRHDVSFPGPDGERVRRRLPQFVTTRGGEYFLLPSRSALTWLGGS